MPRVVGWVPVLLLSLATLVSAVVGLDLSRGPSLIFPVPINSGSVGVAQAHQGDRWSIGMESTICLSKTGKVELTAVTPERAEGLRVTGFAVRLNQNWKPTQGHPGVFLGEERAPLEHFGFTSRTVDVACAHGTSKGYELAVRVLKTTAGPRSRLGGSSHTEAPGANGPSPSRSGYSCALLSRLTQGNAKSKARKPRSAA